MTSEPEQQTEMAIVDVVPGGSETQAAVRVERIKARDLDQSHVGQWIGAHAPDYNYGLKILAVRHVNQGNAPGVTVRYRPSQLPDGRPSIEATMHVPFDADIELVDMMAW